VNGTEEPVPFLFAAILEKEGGECNNLIDNRVFNSTKAVRSPG
jgi:hypothetical protein